MGEDKLNLLIWGSFVRGLFFGDDVEGGVPVKVRFDWTACEAPVWEQPMSADYRQTWERNGVMRFERVRHQIAEGEFVLPVA